MRDSSRAGYRAHPRSRGENGNKTATAKQPHGSSPLTRGKRSDLLPSGGGGGLIPAHAGKTGKRVPGCRVERAHPRSRGENPRGAPGPDVDGGSSPLTRGKRRRDAQALPRRRAHPRSRGENSSGVIGVPCAMGSSPLTRGKRARGEVLLVFTRLIPAHAGKTGASALASGAAGAHPRSRGENAMRAFTGALMKGSSPLTRGKLGQVRGCQAHQRLIPAHAGKTCPLLLAWTSRGAHPRSRGENPRTDSAPRARRGSSPLTRGKPRRNGLPCNVGGLIPAHAGKTLRVSQLALGVPAHPRSRGENTYAGEDRNPALGSSPLTRGKLDVVADVR